MDEKKSSLTSQCQQGHHKGYNHKHECRHDYKHGLENEHDHKHGLEHDHNNSHEQDQAHAHEQDRAQSICQPSGQTDDAHAHHHSHDHAHHHHEFQAGEGKIFFWAIGLNLLFISVEVVFGFWSQSLALLADAGHNLGDVMGLSLAWGAYALGRLAASSSYTFGLQKASVLAALTNAVILIIVIFGIFWQAGERFFHPAEVHGKTVIVVAFLGFLINFGTALLFHSRRKNDLNMRGAYLHMMSDAGISLGVAVTGLLILQTGWNWLDPAISLLVGAMILWGTWSLFQEALLLALNGVPKNISLDEIRQTLRSLDGVSDLHHLHVWALSTQQNALSVHLVIKDEEDFDLILKTATNKLKQKCGIDHVTIQIEKTSCKADIK